MFDMNVTNMTMNNCTINYNMSKEQEDSGEFNFGNREYIVSPGLDVQVISSGEQNLEELILTDFKIGEPRQRFLMNLSLQGYTIENAFSNYLMIPVSNKPDAEVVLMESPTSNLRFWRPIIAFISLNTVILRLQSISTGFYLRVGDPGENPQFRMVPDRNNSTALFFSTCVS